MNDQERPPRLTELTFHGPLSQARADRIVKRLVAADPRSVLDIGCGWGELLLQTLAAAPEATGVGIDINEADLARGRQNATARDLDNRVQFLAESAVGTGRGPADLVLCLGASQALSDLASPAHVPAALAELRRLVAPGGRVLLGEGYWERQPTQTELANMWPDTTADEFPDLAGLVDMAIEAGFRPARIDPASLEEWDEFESAYQGDREAWLATHPTHPDAGKIQADLDEHRSYWLRGFRGVLGLAYLTLVPVG